VVVLVWGKTGFVWVCRVGLMEHSAVFARKDFPTLRQNGLSELRSMMHTAETEFLSGNGPCIGGSEECTLGDIHANWMIKWALHTIDVVKEPGFDASAFPKVHKWCAATPVHDDEVQKGHFVEAEEATKQILEAPYACPEIGIDETDPLQLKGGESVHVEMTDATSVLLPNIARKACADVVFLGLATFLNRAL